MAACRKSPTHKNLQEVRHEHTAPNRSNTCCLPARSHHRVLPLQTLCLPAGSRASEAGRGSSRGCKALSHTGKRLLAKLTGGCFCFISPQLTVSRNASSRIFLSRSAPGESTSLFLRHGLARRWEWIVVQACSYDFTATTSQQRYRCDGSELRSTGARKGRVQVSNCLATGAHGCLNQLQHQFHHSAASEPEVMTSPTTTDSQTRACATIAKAPRRILNSWSTASVC